MKRALISLTVMTAVLAGCGSVPITGSSEGALPEEVTARPGSRPTARPVQKKGGGYYKDDGPADDIPDNLEDIPDAQPRLEPLHKPATRPYVVLGRQYIPNTTLKPYKARGIASWYGKKFHGQKTSIGEPYNMFAMTAAHTTLALPSYVRVTNPRSGKSVVVRITDRGPFHAGRIIDLSYTAAHKLGIINSGSSEVEVEAIIPSGSPTVLIAEAPSAKPTVKPPTAAEERDDIAELMKRLERQENQATPQKGLFLQLGAFSNADNAENLKNHLASELDWLVEPMLIQASGGIHRLQVGPYASREEALKVAERIWQALGTKPTLVNR
ncbi:MAG: septal ring lytic transglycosylase RlpA family protein [Proteobacteria bacterium]|nr:septal ring lytic transglycosylase RlpA family protein [Pseudomonadota bacterium]